MHLVYASAINLISTLCLLDVCGTEPAVFLLDLRLSLYLCPLLCLYLPGRMLGLFVVLARFRLTSWDHGLIVSLPIFWKIFSSSMIYFLQEDRGSKYSAAVYADNECRADEDRSRLALDFLRYFPSRIIQSN